MRRVFIAMVIIMMSAAVLLLGACDSKDAAENAKTQTGDAAQTSIAGNTAPVTDALEESSDEAEKAVIPPVPGDAPNPVVTITMESGAEIVLELYRDKAPNTVNNFVSLAQSGFYDGLNFHRVKEGFMIQGGCPLGTGGGNPGYRIKGEFSKNGFEGNDLSHIQGVISMARSNDLDSAGCQFFICAGDASFLDGDYAAFGKTISGLKEVFAMAKLNKDDGPPSTPQIIKSVTVDTFGYQYPDPETLPR